MIVQEIVELEQLNAMRLYAEDSQEYMVFEENYLKSVHVLANNKKFVEEIMQMIRKNEFDKEIFIQQVCVVVLYSNNESYAQEVVNLAVNMDVEFEKVLAVLEEAKQHKVIEILLKFNTPKSLTTVAKCSVANGYKEYLKYFFIDGELVELDDKVAGFALLCRLGGEKEKSYMKNLFEQTKHPLLKEQIALELIHAKVKEAREYIKEFHTIKSYEAFAYMSFSEDSTFIKETFLKKYNESDREFTAAFYRMFSVWYGNPKLIPFYQKMLHDKDVAMQFNEILLRFFFYDEEMESLEKLMEEWEETLEEIEDTNKKEYKRRFEEESVKVQQEIIKFWKAKEDYISKTLDTNKRYYVDDPFDLTQIWTDEMVDDFFPEHAELTYKGLMLLTGEYFAFDVNGLRSRQLEQSKVILDYLEKHKEKFAAGNWTVWGMDYKSFKEYSNNY